MDPRSGPTAISPWRTRHHNSYSWRKNGGSRAMTHFDVVVCGLGAMGSAAAHHLARRGKRVLGIERYAPGHDRGSSHGRTRIIRLGYFEHPFYVPLLRHAYGLWRELERAAGHELLHVTGIAEIGPPDGALVKGTLSSARLHELPHEAISAPELMRRFRLSGCRRITSPSCSRWRDARGGGR